VRYEEAHACLDSAREKYKESERDYKKLAKILHRKARVYEKEGDLDNAIKLDDDSLLEYNDYQVKMHKKAMEKQKAEVAKMAYINPELGEEAR